MSDIEIETAESAIPLAASPSPEEAHAKPSSSGETAMPPEVAAAVVAVMGKVKQLGYDETNKFANYRYVSVDKFFELVRPLMSAAGLFTVLFETGVSTERRASVDDRGQTKESVRLILTYDIYLFHISGASFGPVRRKTDVLANGAQAYGAGASYVEKYFLRSLFKIATGDKDADAEPEEIESSPLIDVDQVVYLESLIKETATDLGKVLEVADASSLRAMNQEQFKTIVGFLERKKKRAK